MYSRIHTCVCLCIMEFYLMSGILSGKCQMAGHAAGRPGHPWAGLQFGGNQSPRVEVRSSILQSPNEESTKTRSVCSQVLSPEWCRWPLAGGARSGQSHRLSLRFQPQWGTTAQWLCFGRVAGLNCPLGNLGCVWRVRDGQKKSPAVSADALGR